MDANVPPVHPIPPPTITFSRTSRHIKGYLLTLTPYLRLRVNGSNEECNSSEKEHDELLVLGARKSTMLLLYISRDEICLQATPRGDTL